MLHKAPTFPLHFPSSHSHSPHSLSLSRCTSSVHRISSTRHSNLPTATTAPESNPDAALLSLLQSKKTEQAYNLFSTLSHLPDSTCLSRLLAQLSYNAKTSPISLSRAKSLVRKLVSAGELHRLDGNSLGLLANAAATAGNASLAASVVRSMLRMGILPHVKAWTSAVSSLAGSDSLDALKIFHSVMKRIRQAHDADVSASHSSSNFDLTNSLPDTAAFNAALNACANLGDIKQFSQIFSKDMAEFKTKPDILTYNILIKLYARFDRRDLILLTLEKIININIEPCLTTFTSIIAAFVGFGDLNTAEIIIQAMRESRTDICQLLRDQIFDNENNENNENMNNRLLMDEGMNELLENMVRNEGPVPKLPKIYQPDTRIYTTLMKGYMKMGRLDDVVCTIKAMKLETDVKSQPDHVTYTTVITALVNAGSMDRALEVFDEMISAKIRPNLRTYNVLLKGYCNNLQVNKAKELMREMETKVGIKPSVESYNTLIDGCILVDDTVGALSYFSEMRDKGIAPSKISYTTIMKAFALSGQPKMAHKVFDEMSKDQRVKMDQPAWNMLVDGYCKLGLLTEAKKVVEQMKEHGFLPDVKTYGSLANCISLVRKPGEALLLWNEIKERCEGSPPFKPDVELLVVLADICVKNAFFRKALEIVACMEENGIPPNKTKYRKIYIEMHSRMFTSKHASQARKDRRRERVRAAEAFKFWLGLPNSYYGSEWSLEPPVEDKNGLA